MPALVSSVACSRILTTLCCSWTRFLPLWSLGFTLFTRQSVLDSVNGNTDRAIDALLGMSDPDYTSDHHAEPQAQAPQVRFSPLFIRTKDKYVSQTQEELDEQLARTLMLEDEREQHAWRAQQQQPPPRPQAQRRTSEGPERDTMTEFTEQFNKIAESTCIHFIS